MSLCVRPITLRVASAHLRRVHKLSPPRGWLLGAGVYNNGLLACVAVLGRPVARALAGCAEVTRVGSDHTEHAASMALAAVTRAGLALGYRRLVSYTTIRESGTSYRAAGWHPVELCDGGEWTRPSRARGGGRNA